MTIAAAYLTSEGVVLGADSATTVTMPLQQGVLQVLNHSQKVFEVGDSGTGRMGLCTWGAGIIGQTSHRTIVARLAEAITKITTVEEAANLLVDLVKGELLRNPAPISDLGYFLGGWDSADHSPKCYMISIKTSPPVSTTIDPLIIGLAVFQGAPEVFTRTFYGFDPRLPVQLLSELKKQLGSPPAGFDNAFITAFQNVSASLRAVGYADLPLREAIDFIHTYLHVTIKAFKFRFGPPPCGGPIEIGFISTDRHFRWVLHKGFGTAIFEQEVGIQ